MFWMVYLIIYIFILFFWQNTSSYYCFF